MQRLDYDYIKSVIVYTGFTFSFITSIFCTRIVLLRCVLRTDLKLWLISGNQKTMEYEDDVIPILKCIIAAVTKRIVLQFKFLI